MRTKEPEVKIAIIGSGISGLACAYDLLKTGVMPTTARLLPGAIVFSGQNLIWTGSVTILPCNANGISTTPTVLVPTNNGPSA